ncbi:MAG: periplasmic heavy metal sensor [bacterium]
MNSFPKYKIATRILAGLLILALSALGSMIYHTWFEEKQPSALPACTSSCQILVSELDLDSSQNAKLERILDQYNEPAEALVDALRESRMALMEELRKDSVDTLRIRSLANEIGAGQALLTRLASDQYLQIRMICDSSQQRMLSEVYCDLFGCPRQGMGMQHGNGKGQGKQHRFRHGNQGN